MLSVYTPIRDLPFKTDANRIRITEALNGANLHTIKDCLNRFGERLWSKPGRRSSLYQISGLASKSIDEFLGIANKLVNSAILPESEIRHNTNMRLQVTLIDDNGQELDALAALKDARMKIMEQGMTIDYQAAELTQLRAEYEELWKLVEEYTDPQRKLRRRQHKLGKKAYEIRLAERMAKPIDPNSIKAKCFKLFESRYKNGMSVTELARACAEVLHDINLNTVNAYASAYIKHHTSGGNNGAARLHGA